MRPSFATVLVAVAAALSSTVFSPAQTQSPGKNMGQRQQSSSASRKGVIERRFLSAHPLPQRHLDGAVPGALILDRFENRGEALRQRIRAASVTRGVTNASSMGTYPGVALRPTLPTNQLPTSIAAGDFNKDGHMDFVIANGDTNDLWLYLGNGDGTFQLPRIIPLSKGLSPIYVVGADLRNSGNLDLVVAEFDTSTIGVLQNNGDGTFGYEQTYALPQPPSALVLDDFNHDGHLDIAAVMQTLDGFSGGPAVPYIALLAGDGIGNFASPIITKNAGFYSSATSLASGDLNGDGLPDLLITGPGLENSQVFLNNGDGTFKAGPTVAENEPLILMDGHLADVNGDGCIDAVVADATAGVWVALGDCSGNFKTTQLFPMGDSPAAVRVADINGDGILDLVTTSTPVIGSFNVSSIGNTLDVAFGDGKGNFGIGRTYQGPGESLSLAVADFNGDGKEDVVTINNDTSSATLYLNDGTGSFGFPQGIYSGISNQNVALSPEVGPSFADLNGDGATDAFFIGYASNPDFYAISFLNDGTGRFAPAVASDSGLAFQNIGDHRLGDFRSSGKLDLLAIGRDIAFSGSSQYILFMQGNGDGTFGKGTLVTPNGADGLLAIGDFNKDGKLDFVTVNGYQNHVLTPFLGNGDGTFRVGAPINFSDGNVIGRVFAGDFNRDGKMDVLVLTTNNVLPASPDVWEFLGNGDGTFQAGKQLFTGFEDFTLADLNGDGCPDIAQYDLYLTRNPESPPSTFPATFTNFLCQANGSFAESSAYSPYMGTYDLLAQYNQFGETSNSPLIGDFNGDGKLDEVAWQNGTGYSRYLQMLAGNGDGTFTPTYDIFPRYILNSPYYSHDLNGDGYSDLLQSSILSNSLNVIKGAPAPALQIELEEVVVTGNQGCGWVFPNVVAGSDRSVTLSSSVSGVLLPASVTIPANAASAQFCYSLANNFDWRQVFDINAQLNGNVATAYASDSYVFGFDEELSPTTVPAVYSGDSSEPITVSVTAASGYSSTVNLSCKGMPTGDSCQFGSTRLNVSSGGAASTTVTLVTGANPGQTGDNPQFTIVADDGNVTRQQTIGIYVATLGIQGATANLQVLGIPPYSLSCSGLPAGTTCSFTGSAVNYPNPSFYTDTIAVPSGMAAGDYQFQITVASGSHTASISQSLNVVNLTVEGPDASNDWAIVGTTQEIPVTVQLSSNASATTLQLNCSLDVTATCSGGSPLIQPGTQSVNLALTIPSGTTTGQHQLTVTANLGGYTQSFTFPVAVVALSGSLNASSMALTQGASESVTATLSATTGFAGSVSLTCRGSSEITCSFNPTLVQLTGGTSQTSTVTLTAGNLAETQPDESLFRRSGMIRLAVVLPLVLLPGIRRRKWLQVFTALLALCVVGSAVSCGGSGGGGGGRGGGSNTYTVTVTGTANSRTASTTIGTIVVTVTH
jgi:FG-GAP-like repeat